MSLKTIRTLLADLEVENAGRWDPEDRKVWRRVAEAVGRNQQLNESDLVHLRALLGSIRRAEAKRMAEQDIALPSSPGEALEAFVGGAVLVAAIVAIVVSVVAALL